MKNTTKTYKYTPKTTEELKTLVEDKSVHLGDIDTSHITDMGLLFIDSRREDFSGIESWDVSNVEDMSLMFSGAKFFNHPIDSWDVSKVKDMHGMFELTNFFNQPLNSWDVSKVNDFKHMFAGAKSFVQNLDSWQIQKDADMYGIFTDSAMSVFPKWLESKNKNTTKTYKYTPKTKEELKKLVDDENVYLGDIDTGAITDMSRLFLASTRKDFNGIESWDVSNVEDMNHMFYVARSFNQPLDSWDVSNVKGMEGMFGGAVSFNQPLNSWNVSKVKTMEYMFGNAVSFNQSLNSWNVSKVENMCEMFKGAKAFNQPLDKWNVSKVEDMDGMFCGAESFNQNLDSWSVAKDAKKEQIFIGSGMSEYPKWLGFPKLRKGANGKYTPLSRNELVHMVYDESIYLGDIDTSHITDMSRLFYYSQREDFSGIESWDVSKVEGMEGVFASAESFNQNLDSWQVKEDVNTDEMFENSGMSTLPKWLESKNK